MINITSSKVLEGLILYLVIHLIVMCFYKLYRWFLPRTNREMAIWLHYMNKTLDKGHQHKTPVECKDGLCSYV